MKDIVQIKAKGYLIEDIKSGYIIKKFNNK